MSKDYFRKKAYKQIRGEGSGIPVWLSWIIILIVVGACVWSLLVYG